MFSRLIRGLATPLLLTCAKREVTAYLIVHVEDLNSPPPKAIFRSTNYCLSPQDVCPREEGEGYEKCKTLCRQVAHAEINVLSEAGELAKGSTLVLKGHDHCCDDCVSAMKKAGVKEIMICNGGVYELR